MAHVRERFGLGRLGGPLRIRTLAAQAERITPLGDLTDFAELAG
jgi:hypothetical protein